MVARLAKSRGTGDQRYDGGWVGKNDPMAIAYGCCPRCGGDLFLDYKGGSRWKCIQGSHYFLSGDRDIRERLLREHGTPIRQILKERR